MNTSRRKLLALFGLGPVALASPAAAASASNLEAVQRNLMLYDAAARERRQHALAFVKSVNDDFLRYGLPPLDDGYIMRALGQA